MQLLIEMLSIEKFAGFFSPDYRQNFRGLRMKKPIPIISSRNFSCKILVIFSFEMCFNKHKVLLFDSGL